MKPLLVSSGEPAGIGPDLCLALAKEGLPLVIMADKDMMQERARLLKYTLEFVDYDPNQPIIPKSNQLTILSIPCTSKVIPGQLNKNNAAYVIKMLESGVQRCLSGEFSALVTAPVHKGIINQAGISFTGHTEFLAKQCGVKTVVMMLAYESMRVALVTTHLPLKEVPSVITQSLIIEVVTQVNKSLIENFSITNPNLLISGLNPHAGEGGYLGREEIDVIQPAIETLIHQGMNIKGPLPADTMFTLRNQKNCDAFIVMYHDQGLPVLKYAGFGAAVNITLGLPIVRTSVDHGTALELAGTGHAETASLHAALKMAESMVKKGHLE